MFILTEAHLRAISPKAKAAYVDPFVRGFNEFSERYDVVTVKDAIGFLAQVMHESQGLTVYRENLNYSASRLYQVFNAKRSSVKMTKAEAAKLARNPKAIANRIYGGRMGNRPGTDDGWNYAGKGPIQDTGRDMYAWLQDETGLPLLAAPELAADPEHAAHVALATWKILRAPSCNNDILCETRRINGGTNGLADRKAWHAKCETVLADCSDVPLPVARPAYLVEAAQRQLHAAGYFEVGAADGDASDRTAAATMAFQRENGLDVTGELDDATLAALPAAPPRRVSEARANTTAADLKAKGSRIVSGSWSLKKIAGWLFGAGAIAVGGDDQTGLGLLDQAAAVAPQVQTVAETVQAVFAGIGSHWPLVFLAVAGGVWFIAHRIEQARVEDHRMGKTP